MNKKLFGYIFNFLLLGGYGVFCWYYSYLKPGYAQLNVFLEVLKFAGIFLAAFAVSAMLHRLGHILFAVFQGLGICNNTAFSRRVRIRLKGSFDTPSAFEKNHRKYSKFLLGGLIFNAAAIFIAAVIYALSLASRAVFSPQVVVSLALMISGWYMVYAAFSNDTKYRGDFISYQRSRSLESLAVTLAGQCATEKPDNAFLVKEAQSIIAFRIENGLPLPQPDTENALTAIALYAAEGKIDLNPVIESYLDVKV